MLQNFVISFFTLTYVLLDELIPFHGKNFAPRSIKKESYRYPHCIFQSVFALNTRSVKSHSARVIKDYTVIKITLLIKRQFYAAHSLVLNICLRSVIGRKYLINKYPETEMSQ